MRPRAQQQQLAVSPESHNVLDDEYNKQMAKQMHWDTPFEYHFDRGLYFHEVAPGLCCGTQPRNPAEVEQLAKRHGINVIVNLQQDKDMQHWGVDFEANQRKCTELGLQLIRKPAIDFDPHSLRKTLPTAVKEVGLAIQQGKRVYVHCTAGLGRAPAVCIGYLYWYGPYLSLHEAYDHLTSIRPCGPKKEAIRGATFDILDDRHFDQFFGLPEDAWAFLNQDDKHRLQQRLYDHWH